MIRTHWARLAGLMALGFGTAASSWASDAPDWALHMIGSWRGAGVRVELANRAKTRIEAQVETHWVSLPSGSGVVSRNHIKETLLGSNGLPVRSKEYDRIYWVTEVSRQADRVELRLGGGELPGEGAASVGAFDPVKLMLTSTQQVSGNIRVEIQTQFGVEGLDGETLSLERVWLGNSLYTEGQIRYTRSKF